MAGEKFHKRLNQLIEREHMTRQDVAKATGLSMTTVRYFTLGERMPNAQTLCMLADFFHVTMDWLFGRVP